MAHSYHLYSDARLRPRSRWMIVLIALAVVCGIGALVKLTSGPSSATTKPATVGIYTGTEKPSIPSEDDERSVELIVRGAARLAAAAFRLAA